MRVYGILIHLRESLLGIFPILITFSFCIDFYESKYGCSGIDFLVFKPFGLNQMVKLLDAAATLYHKRRAYNFLEKL